MGQKNSSAGPILGTRMAFIDFTLNSEPRSTDVILIWCCVTATPCYHNVRLISSRPMILSDGRTCSTFLVYQKAQDSTGGPLAIPGSTLFSPFAVPGLALHHKNTSRICLCTWAREMQRTRDVIRQAANFSRMIAGFELTTWLYVELSPRASRKLFLSNSNLILSSILILRIHQKVHIIASTNLNILLK